jgi:hypothetical protein
MKLLYCRRCKDIITLGPQLRGCLCGGVKGMYADELHAQYTGVFAVPIGILNNSLEAAVKAQLKKDTDDRKGGVRFEAFVIPQVCATMERIS